MMVILLLTANRKLASRIEAALPPAVDLKRMDSLPPAWPEGEEKPALILCDASTNLTLLGECDRFRQSLSTGDISLIAVIARPGDRRPALEAGADDYLLHPFTDRELRTRLEAHLQWALLGARDLFYALQTVYAGGKGNPTLQRGLKNLARALDAPAAWLLHFNAPKKVRLLGEFHAPPLIRQLDDDPTLLSPCLQALLQSPATPFPPTLCNCLADYPPAETGGLTCHLTIPLQSSNSSSWPLASTNMLGALVLAYPSPPRISTLQRRQLRWLGEGMAAVLEIVSLQYQSQTYAVQNAFLVLLARLVNEYRQSDALFSQILEQTLPLFNAIAGVIWLLSEDGRRLERAAHLSTLGYTLYQQPARRPADGGIAGRVIQNRRTVQLSVPTDDPHFDPLLDGLDSLGPYTLLAVPLQYRDTVVGMLSLYARNPRYFSPQNVLLLESITSLTASAIIHMQLVQKLRDYGRQKTVLYEMGQQISTTLNLSITLRRTLQWTARLTGTELGLLWLVESKQEHHPFRLAAVMGVHLPPEQEILFEPERDRSAIALQKREAVLFNTLTGDTHADATLRRLLQPPPRNLIAAPIIYREQTIGLIELFDKSNGPFTEEDRSLLTTALKMAALAIGNAYLHNRTLNLLDERHHLQRQIIQSERLATLGRLTAALAHEINNPMQAIQGALMLALEELDNPAELETYLNLGLEESQRVIDLVHRMRQIYRPVPTRPEQVDVNRILQSALNLAQKELKRRHVTPCTDLATDLPRTTAVADQLHLVFLSLLLNLGEAIGEGGSALHIRTRADADTDAILITFAADVPAAAAGRLTSLISPSSAPTLPLETNLSFGLSFSRDLVAAHNGRLDVRLEEGHVACTIHLPIQR